MNQSNRVMCKGCGSQCFSLICNEKYTESNRNIKDIEVVVLFIQYFASSYEYFKHFALNILYIFFFRF